MNKGENKQFYTHTMIKNKQIYLTKSIKNKKIDQKMSKLTTYTLLFLAIASANCVIVELNKFNKSTCFYVRGAYSNDEFSCQYGVSGEGNKNIAVSVRIHL